MTDNSYAGLLRIGTPVQRALEQNQPVVALESTIIAHGFPWPENLELARKVESAVKAQGATPATVGLCNGQIVVGMSPAEIERFARADGIAKVSRRDLGTTLSAKGDGATTVAGTMICAALAGIRTFATGGLGGVHRGAERTWDVSADLTELSKTRVAVVCSGAKSILDLSATLECLETFGVPVIGFRTDELPAFQARSSGLRLDVSVDCEQAVAQIMRLRDQLGLEGGEVIANPVPSQNAIPLSELEVWIDTGMAEAARQGIKGKAITPFLLQQIARLSGHRTVAANEALVVSNAKLAARIAAAYQIL